MTVFTGSSVPALALLKVEAQRYRVWSLKVSVIGIFRDIAMKKAAIGASSTVSSPIKLASRHYGVVSAGLVSEGLRRLEE
jgi:hypothetical protein